MDIKKLLNQDMPLTAGGITAIPSSLRSNATYIDASDLTKF
jgi:hypothetical protein